MMDGLEHEKARIMTSSPTMWCIEGEALLSRYRGDSPASGIWIAGDFGLAVHDYLGFFRRHFDVSGRQQLQESSSWRNDGHSGGRAAAPEQEIYWTPQDLKASAGSS